ncbi:type VII secretion target [Actinoplanes sp. NPDC051861]|uniref:type VII secretion target n=1 Tax=Actinoplanes sp. NPDC051861 TaxID=3155170 RepID=UPI00342FF9D4
MNVPPSDVRRHADHLDHIADDLDTVRHSAATTRPGAESYGRLCTIVPVLLQQLHISMIETVGSGTASLRDTAAILRRAAGDYESADDESAVAIRTIGGGR